MAHVVRLATLAYWTPALAIDAIMLWRGGLGGETAMAVFWALFRETVLFLAVWFTLGLVQALLFGRSAHGAARPRRKPKAAGRVLTPTRDRGSH
jgi:hypothetical protein